MLRLDGKKESGSVSLNLSWFFYLSSLFYFIFILFFSFSILLNFYFILLRSILFKIDLLIIFLI